MLSGQFLAKVATLKRQLSSRPNDDESVGVLFTRNFSRSSANVGDRGSESRGRRVLRRSMIGCGVVDASFGARKPSRGSRRSLRQLEARARVFHAGENLSRCPAYRGLELRAQGLSRSWSFVNSRENSDLERVGTASRHRESAPRSVVTARLEDDSPR